MSTTPTPHPQRTDALRTFLVVEAASSAPTATPARRGAGAMRRSAVAGGVALALVAGGLVAVSLPDDAPTSAGSSATDRAAGATAPATLPALETISVERSDGWTTVALTDIDADPDAVVADLEAAGFAAERLAMPVEVGPDGQVTVDGPIGSDGVQGFGMFAVGTTDGGAWGAEGLVGISVTGDDLWMEAPPETDVGSPDATAPVVLGDDAHRNVVRLHHDGTLSIADGAAVRIVVYAAP